MATLPGSMLVGISSPYRRGGLLWQKFKDHYGKPGDVLVVRASSKLLNPTLDQAIIDQALADDPEAAKSEWLGEFRNDLAAYVDRETIEAAVDRDVTVRPPRKDIKAFAFLDPSGGMRDSFTCAIAREGRRGGARLPGRDQGTLQSDAAHRADRRDAEGARNHDGSLRYGAAWVTDAFSKCGITVRHSDRDRIQIYLDALPLFMAGRARLAPAAL
jgi:hypothetical protein